MKPTEGVARFLRTFFLVGAAISGLAIIQTQVQTEALLKLRTRYKWAIFIVVLAVNLTAGLYVGLRRSDRNAFWERLDVQSSRLRKPAAICLAAVLLLAPVPVLLYARADFFGRGLEAFFRLLWLFWWLVLVQAAGVRLATGTGWFRSLSMVLLADGLAAQLCTLSAGISSYPFSMGWSEASRYYYGSLVFAKSIYGEYVPLSVMHGSRYLLQAIPYAFTGVSLWAARLWQVLLWMGLTLLSAWALVRRLNLEEKAVAAMVIGWLFLFYFQGAVYYHLQVCVILVLLWVSHKKPRLSPVAIGAASLWAGMSRVNWFPVPAMLAIAIYLLERPLSDARNRWTYWATPFLWGATGLLAALGGQALYIIVSGNQNLEAFASSFTSALLWYRWLPSPTNPIGIMPGVLIVSLPLAAGIGAWLRARRRAVHPLRIGAVAAMLAILLAGGLVVSTKIGGGGDLHNMDAYLVLLALLGSYCLWGPIAAERSHESAQWNPPPAIVLMTILVPVAFSLLRLAGPSSYDAPRAAAELSTLRREVLKYGADGEVLFMYERHLLTFGVIPGIHLVPDYEVVTLMEMAISGNQAYLSQYYKDLEEHRFRAIVAHPQNLGVETGDFIEENNAWSRLVGQPLLCQYKPALTLNYSKVQILVPRERPCTEFPPVIEP